MWGTLGHLAILTGFVGCALACFAFTLAARRDPIGAEAYSSEGFTYLRLGRWAWIAMTVLITASSAILIYLIVSHQFQYAYVYQNSSRDLPLKYVFSSFWAGQEGSKLLWATYTGLVGLALLKWAGRYEAPVMAVVAFCQIFMISMVVGLQFGPLPIGADPFMMLADKFPDAPIFQSNPGFIPADGNGLNDLLQNYWMMIHPPTLFVGFATMIVPFAFAVAALWQKRYTEWVRPALPWTLFSLGVLMVGIVMGGYWAYETLNFGGYWAWDPVENSSFVPWLVGVAAVHMMIVQKKSGASHKAALFLCILAYMLVIYSTFLTRSGVLGDVSVHSFVDLGLSNQYLVWILAMGVVGFGFFAARYRSLPKPKKEPNVLSREFMIFSGAIILSAIAAAVIMGTSAPILGRIFRDSPSAVPISFYNNWTLPLAIGLMFLIGLGQLFWWQKMRVETINRVLLKPVALSVVATLVVLVLTPFAQLTAQPLATDPGAIATMQAGFLGGLGEFWARHGYGLQMLLLLFVSFFAFFGNAQAGLKVARGNFSMVGGALAHVGVALMLLGIIASSGFSNTLTDAPDRDNFIIARGQTKSVEGFLVTYEGSERNERGRGVYTVRFTDPSDRTFDVHPVAYQTERGEWIEHPDVKPFLEQDLFVAVSPAARFAEQVEEDENGGTLTLAANDSTVVGDQEYAIHFVGYDTQVDPQHVPDSVAVAVSAVLKVTNLVTRETRELRPIYLVMEDGSQQYVQNRVRDWDLVVTFAGMNVTNGEADFVLEGVQLMPEDWVLVQAHVKPFINLLWLGSIVMTLGFGIAFMRRRGEQRHSARRS